MTAKPDNLSEKEPAHILKKLRSEVKKLDSELRTENNECNLRAAELEKKPLQTSQRQRYLEDQITCAEAQIALLCDLLKVDETISETRES